MTEKLTPRDAVKIFFETSLGRAPDENELVIFENEYLNGLTLKELALKISNSDEAKSLQINRIFSSMTIKDLMNNRSILNSTLTISSDDIMNSIAQLYEKLIKREPSFYEVHRHFSNLKFGSNLSDIFSNIANSQEALSVSNSVKSRLIEEKNDIRRIMSILYKEILERPISEEEVDIWFNNHVNGSSVGSIVIALSESDEANTVASNRKFSEWNAGRFVQLLYDIFQNRGATPAEITFFREHLERGHISSELLLRRFFLDAGRERAIDRSNFANNPESASLFGGSQPYVTIEEWNQKSLENEANIDAIRQADKPASAFRRFPLVADAKPLVSIITSLFKGGRFIRQFMENMVGQSIFPYCELIIIDANSPDGESAIIKDYQNSFKNIVYKKFDSRIGIYDAWNIGVKSSNGIYCTNANLDDCRRKDSIELQASVLDNMSFVDVVYQDVFYSFKENLLFDEIARHGFSTNLPIVSRYNLMEFNCPHNGPMWRKRLHDEVGLFDASLQSAGDFDFWLRCHIAGKTFFKLNDPHVGYYVNPEGLSTRADTKGSAEANMLSKKYYKQIISDNVICDESTLDAKVKPWLPGPIPNVARYGKFQAALRHLSIASRQGAGF